MLKIENELNSIFTRYSKLIEDASLRKIIQRGYVYSRIRPVADVLICGFNPSYRNDFVDEKYSYSFKGAQQDRYFKKFHTLFEPYSSQTVVDYFDLFYQRHTKQNDIHLFLKSELGTAFLCEQLCLTQKLIETIKPKVIFVFNRFAANFWGINSQEKDNRLFNVWLGYQFEKTSINNLYQITGFIDSKERLNFSKKETNLVGCYVYFSRFLNHYASTEEMSTIRQDLHSIKSLVL